MIISRIKIQYITSSLVLFKLKLSSCAIINECSEQKAQKETNRKTSDANNDKVTSVGLLGMDEAENMMNRLYKECMSESDTFSGFDSRGLKELIESIRTRTK